MVVVALVTGLQGVAVAAPEDPSMSSAGYRLNESDVGATGDFSGASGGYRFEPGVDDGGSSLGESAVGDSSSANYQTGGGFNTTAQPGLAMCVGTSGTSCSTLTGSSIDFGDLSTSVASTAIAKFAVKNYTSYGYVVTVIGSPPSNSGHALAGMGTQSANSTGCTPVCASQVGVEQFGMNMRLNGSPVTVGADPVAIPSTVFSLDDPNVIIPTPYRTVDEYRYFSGDTVASAPRSSGETLYTATFIANMSNVTPGGKYTGALEFLATGTY